MISFIILKQALQLLTRKEDPALYRTLRQTKTVGYLTVLETRNVHQKGNTIVARQTIDNTIYLFCIITIVGNVIIQFTRTIQMKQVIGLIHENLIPDLFTVVVYEDITHYRIYPAFEVCPRCIFVHITQCLQRCLLQQIVRLISIGREFVGKALQLRLYLKQLSPEFCSIQSVECLNVRSGKIAGI